MIGTKSLARYISAALTIAIFMACSGTAEQGKKVDEGVINNRIFTSEEIGWTIEVPEGWKITDLQKQKETDKKGADAMKQVDESIQLGEYNNLIGFHKDELNSFGSTSEAFDERTDGSWLENTKRLNAFIMQTYESQGITCDSISGTETIDGLEFQMFKTSIFGADSVPVLEQIMYSRLINGRDFGVNINYNNDKDRDEMMKAWKASKFRK